MLSTVNPHIVQWFRRHLRMVFDSCDGHTTAGWLVEEQRRLAQQILRSGLSDKCHHLLKNVMELPEANEPFEVFVIGEGKFGKSTFINAVLGLPVAPMDFLPKTWCFNRYIATATPSASVKLFLLPDYKRLRPELCKWLGEPIGEKRGLLMFEVSREVAETIVQHEENLISNLSHKHALLDDLVYVSPIMEMEWEVASDRAILPNIRLVDTQGINQLRRSRDHLHYLKWQFSRADSVIWLMSAEKLNSSATRDELVEARRYSKSILLVINRWDKIADPDRARRLCEQLYAHYVTNIVYFSALAALFSVCPDILPFLPGPAKADIAQICKNNKLPNPLQNQHEVAQKLREISGLECLSHVLRQQLLQKLRYIRNRTLYTTLRQQQREFYRIAHQSIDEKRQNLSSYGKIMSIIRQSYLENTQSVQEMVRELYGLIDQIKSRIAELRWEFFEGDSKRLNAYLRLEEFEIQLTRLADKFSLQCSKRFQQAVLEIGEKNLYYKENQYDPSGQVVVTQNYIGIGNISISVTSAARSPEIKVNMGFWHKILERLQKVVLLGPVVEVLFSGVVEKMRQDCVNEIITEARRGVHQMCQSVEDLRRSFGDQIERVRHIMIVSAENCFAQVGDVRKLPEEIAIAEEALTEPSVRCVFMLLLLRAVRKLGKEP